METFYFSRKQPAQRCAKIQKASGGAGRDRTDDILLAKQALSQLSYSPDHTREKVVGLVRFELTTSRLSSARSNQLSYKPACNSPKAIKAFVVS